MNPCSTRSRRWWSFGLGTPMHTVREVADDMNRLNVSRSGLCRIGGLRPRTPFEYFQLVRLRCARHHPQLRARIRPRVRYGTYESIPEMLAKVMIGNSGWDVIFPSAEYIQPMRDMGLLARLKHDWLPESPATSTGSSATSRESGAPTGRFPTCTAQRNRPSAEPRLDSVCLGRSVGYAPTGSAPRSPIRRKCSRACLTTLGYSLDSADPSQPKAAEQRRHRANPCWGLSEC